MKKTLENKGVVWIIFGLTLVVALSFSSGHFCAVNAGQKGTLDPAMYDEGRLRDPCTDYDWVGKIEEVGRDGKYVIVDDSMYKFSSSTTYHSPGRRNISRLNIKPGKKIGFILNDKKEIVSLCLMKQ